MEGLVGPVGLIVQEGFGVEAPGVLWNLHKVRCLRGLEYELDMVLLHLQVTLQERLFIAS